jgi:hypothetical protein
MARMPLESPIKPYESSQKLSQSGLDPIVEMTNFIDMINDEMLLMRFDDEGNPKSYSQVAYASMLVTKQAAINNLLKYGYSSIPVKQEVVVSNLPKISIITTDSDDFSLVTNNVPLTEPNGGD